MTNEVQCDTADSQGPKDGPSQKQNVPPMAALKRVHGELWHLLRNIPQHGYTFFTLKAMFERVCDDLEQAAKQEAGKPTS